MFPMDPWLTGKAAFSIWPYGYAVFLVMEGLTGEIELTEGMEPPMAWWFTPEWPEGKCWWLEVAWPAIALPAEGCICWAADCGKYGYDCAGSGILERRWFIKKMTHTDTGR